MSHGRKVPIPRKLDTQETAASLRLWRVAFSNYYRADAYFGIFIQADTKWNVTADDWGFADEGANSHLKRTKAQLKSDCSMFLETLASYLPDDYLVEKISKNTKDMAGVWEIIESYYGVQISSETFLALSKLKKKSTESHRQFYLRIEGFVSKHLTKGSVKVEDVTSPPAGDKLTISLKNVLVILWLDKIHDKLIDCVRLDYAQELREGKQLIELMPRIADNVENILARHDVAGGVSRLAIEEDADGDVQTHVQRIDQARGRGQRGGRGGGRASARGQVNQPQIKAGTCAHCEYLSQTLRLKINSNHDPQNCFRKNVAVRLIEMDNADSFSEASDLGTSTSKSRMSSNLSSFQTENGSCSESMLENEVMKNVPCVQTIQSTPLSDLPGHLLEQKVLRVQQRLVDSEAQPAQARSPALTLKVNDCSLLAVLDEGAEINVISTRLAKKCNLRILPSKHLARAADSSKLRVRGQLASPLNLVTVLHHVPVRLDHVVVVDNLNAELLIGEPGKASNFIITVPFEKRIIIRFHGNEYVFPYESPRGPVSHVVRVSSAVSVAPGEKLFWKVPEQYANFPILQVNPRRQDQPWFRPRDYKVVDGYISIKNTLDTPVKLKRNECFGELRLVTETDIDTKTMDEEEPGQEEQVDRVFQEYPDQTQYSQGVTIKTKDYTDQIALDPDNILSPEEKAAFRKLCSEFKDVIRPEPGRYNGFYGHIDNSINFSARPPPNKKIYQQRLTDDMRKLLGAKLDKLMDWGVLAYPEHVGVRVEFVSPSKLLPKAEPNEFRVVTDFSNLNKHIIKPQGVSPTIQEAKDALAKAPYHIHLDLSNWFYQSGMSREDIQYLGTVHPFKGVVVYRAEPQGLNGSPEHAYEKLGRIYHDLIAEAKLTRMADGIHILGQNVEESRETLREVFIRARNCGLTFKPKKIEIFPQKTTLFGWTLEKSLWSPTVHTTSALSKAPLPKTVKMLRAFLGSFKQFNNCVRKYGELLHDLEQMTGSNKASGEIIKWTPEQEAAFYRARAATLETEAYAIPRPSDQIFTFSDYSKEKRAVGGKMEFDRKMPDGSTKRYLGGHFSMMVDKNKIPLWACEGEGLAIKLVLQFYEPYLRENNNVSIHFTDSKPCVDAWNRARKGAFSTNARISTFLSCVANMPVEIRHKPGKEMLTSDFASRNPQTCPDKTCALCKFCYEAQEEGDNCEAIRSISVEDVTSGKVPMPCTQRKAWLDVQNNDSVHVKLKYLIQVGQVPEKKRTKGDYNKLKLLHNLYQKGELKIDKEGLVLVKQKLKDDTIWVTSIPYQMYPGLCQALHLQFNHPSKGQLHMLMSRYFYTPGHQTIVSDVVDSCPQCMSMKLLPKVIKEFSTTPLTTLGAKFSADVLMRNSQKFLVTVENLSGFTWIEELPDQTAPVIKEALLSHIIPFSPEQGAVVRTDGASSFQTLKAESQKEDSIWAKHSIQIEIGNKMNENKNPCAENKIKEIQKEFLRHAPEGGKMSRLQVLEVAKTLNSRIRLSGLASREILLSRSLMTNEPLNLVNRDLSGDKLANRKYQHEAQIKHQSKLGATEPDSKEFQVGDLVMLRSGNSKIQTRNKYIIHEIRKDQNLAVVRKSQTQLQAKTYPVDLNELILLKCFRAGPIDLKADMSKKENDRKEKKEKEKVSKDENENEKELENRKDEDESASAIKIGKGAPVKFNAAGRPRREAAAKANIAWKSMISNVLFDALAKPPWLQEDQLEEEDDPVHPGVLRLHQASLHQRLMRQNLLHAAFGPMDSDVLSWGEDEPQPAPAAAAAAAAGPPAAGPADESAQQSSADQASISSSSEDLSNTGEMGASVSGSDPNQEHDIRVPTFISPVLSEPPLPDRHPPRVQLGPGAPAQDLTAALEALGIGPPPPPRVQGEVRQSARAAAKPKPDYKALHSGTGPSRN